MIEPIAEGSTGGMNWPSLTRNEDGETEAMILIMLPKGTPMGLCRVASSIPATVHFVDENGNVFCETSAHSVLDMAALGLSSNC